MDSANNNTSLVDRIAAGDTRAVARAISKVEDVSKDASQLMKKIFPLTGRGLVIGITGAPGAGKSSLVDKLALHYRQQGERVGIVAVDPSSPFSGGAILGDRIRMQTLGLGFTYEQLSPGQKFRTLNRTITETDLVMFTGVTGMLEIIFTDHTFGAEKGTIQGRFVPAALTYSLIEGLLCQSMIQGTGLAMLELKKQVLAPVRVGDTIHAEVEVTSVRPTSKGNRGIVVSRIDVKNQKGEVVISYEATRMLAGRSEAQA